MLLVWRRVRPPVMEASSGICSHCRKICASLNPCSVCKQVSYCNATCQISAWKRHKKICAPLPPLKLLATVRETSPARLGRLAPTEEGDEEDPKSKAEEELGGGEAAHCLQGAN